VDPDLELDEPDEPEESDDPDEDDPDDDSDPEPEPEPDDASDEPFDESADVLAVSDEVLVEEAEDPDDDRLSVL
jgi:hypothetical protein